MPKGKPGSGPHAGKGPPIQKPRNPQIGRVNPTHVPAYAKQRHGGMTGKKR